MAETTNTAEEQLGKALELRQSEALGNSELNKVVKAIRDLSELKTQIVLAGNKSIKVDTADELDQVEKFLFGKRDELWDKKSLMVGGFNQVLKADKILTPTQKDQVEEGITTLTDSLQRNDLVRVANQLQEIRRRHEQATGSEKRALELLSSAAELLVAKWSFGRDRELITRLTALGSEEDIGLIEERTETVRDATETTRKRDEAGDRADIEDNKRHTREIWYTEKWNSVNGHEYNRHTSSTRFIRDEIKGEGGVEERGQKLDTRHKFGDGMEEMVNWQFFKQENLNDAISRDRGPDYIKDSLKIIKRVAVWADHEWKTVGGLPLAEKLRQWTVGQAMVREVWRVLQDNVRAGLTLLENDVTGDMLSCRPDPSLNAKIVENKAKGVFEFAVDPQQREKEREAFKQLHDQIAPSFAVTEANIELLKKKGESIGQEEIIRTRNGGEVDFTIPTRSEVFEPMFLYNDKGEIDFNQLEYRVWQARSRLHLLTNTALPGRDPLYEVGVRGPSLWSYIEGAAVFPNKELEPKALEADYGSLIPNQADFWLMHFYLNQGRDVVAKNVNSLSNYKRTLVNRFKEVVVKAYYAPAISKRGEVGVWPDHSQPISPEITKRRIRNLEHGLMIWPESHRPMLVELPYYIQWNSWKAVAHTTEFGSEEYEAWLRVNQLDPKNPAEYIRAFPTFFNQKIMAGLGLHLSTDLIWQTMAMVNEYYPLVWDEKKGRHKIETNPEKLLLSPEGQLWAIYRKQAHEAYQNYIYENLGMTEGIIYNYIRYFLMGKDVPARDARKFIAPYGMELWQNFVFAKHAQEAWCGNSEHPNEFFGRRVIDVDTLEFGVQPNILGEHFEPAPIDRDLTTLFSERGDRLNHKEAAALILTVIPDGVIDRYLVKVLLGRKTSDTLNEYLGAVEKLEKQIWPNEEIKPYSKLLQKIALGASPEEIGRSFARTLNDTSKADAVTNLTKIISQALGYRAGNVYQPDLFYEMFLFSFAREAVGYYKKHRYLRINHAYLADVDVWEEIAKWQFKAGPRKGQPIYYHPMFSPGGTVLADRYLTGMVPISSLNSYGEGGWEGGDFILSITADTIFRTSAATEQDRILLYQELNRFAPRILMDIGSTEFKFSQLHGALADVDVFRPGVKYALTIKYSQLDRVVNKLRLNAFQKKAIKEILFGFSGVWGEVKRNAHYQILDHAFGRPDWWEKTIEWFKKSSETVTRGTPIGGFIGTILDSPLSPIPQFRALLPALAVAIPTAIAVVGAGWIPASVFGVSWLGYYIVGVYASNLVGLIGHWAFSRTYEGIIDRDKEEGVNYRYLPSREDTRKASERISPEMLLNIDLCQAPTLFGAKKLREDHPLIAIEQTQKLFEAIAQDQLATS